MKDQDLELLSQYLDGELDIFSSRKLEQRMTAEPELAETLSLLQQQHDSIKSTFAAEAHAPARVKAMLEPAGNVVAMPQRSSRPAWQYAVAASLVAAAGLVLTPNWQESPTTEKTLATVLESSPSMASGWESLDDGLLVRPVLSFQHTEGHWCREFLLSGENLSSRGVACREQGAWNTHVLADADIPGDADSYRPAGAGDAQAVTDYIADRAAGISLSAGEEAKLIDSNWN